MEGHTFTNICKKMKITVFFFPNAVVQNVMTLKIFFCTFDISSYSFLSQIKHRLFYFLSQNMNLIVFWFPVYVSNICWPFFLSIFFPTTFSDIHEFNPCSLSLMNILIKILTHFLRSLFDTSLYPVCTGTDFDVDKCNIFTIANILYYSYSSIFTGKVK